jgi:hypothetical protein
MNLFEKRSASHIIVIFEVYGSLEFSLAYYPQARVSDLGRKNMTRFIKNPVFILKVSNRKI